MQDKQTTSRQNKAALRREQPRQPVEGGNPAIYEGALDAVNLIIWQGSYASIQPDGVSALGEIEAPALVARLETIANDHPGLEVRNAAVDRLGDLEHNASALTVLSSTERSRVQAALPTSSP